MLPFTKRPGRGDESGDNDVVTKDDISAPMSKRSVPPSSSAAVGAPTGRGKFTSVGDEEMTTLMSTKALGDARPSPRPAAGAPAPSPSRSAPPSRMSNTSSASRSGSFAAQQDEDEDGRTVVRGAPKIVKRAPGSAAKMGMPTSPTTISPAAVIKATLDSARSGVKPKPDHLMAGPPANLLEDFADLHPADAGSNRTAVLQSPSQFPPAMAQDLRGLGTQLLEPQGMPPVSARPMSAPPPPMSSQGGGFAAQSGGFAAQSGGYAAQSGGYAAQSGGHPAQSGGYAAQSGGYAAQSGGYPAQYGGPVPSGSVSVGGVVMPPPSMPAHFMVAQSPNSDARIDPPGTAVAAGRAAGRPAASWALALAAFGLFVGVGAVAVLNGNDRSGVLETSASFVDPSRAAAGKVAATELAAPVVPTAVPVAVPVAASEPAPVAVPAVAPTPEPAAAPAAADTAAAPGPVAAVTAPPPPAVAAPVAAAPAAAPAPVAVAPAAKPAPVEAAPAAKPARPAHTSRPAVAAAPKAAKPAKPASKSGDSALDEEQRKALKALQESQLETSF